MPAERCRNYSETSIRSGSSAPELKEPNGTCRTRNSSWSSETGPMSPKCTSNRTSIENFTMKDESKNDIDNVFVENTMETCNDNISSTRVDRTNIESHSRKKSVSLRNCNVPDVISEKSESSEVLYEGSTGNSCHQDENNNRHRASFNGQNDNGLLKSNLVQFSTQFVKYGHRKSSSVSELPQGKFAKRRKRCKSDSFGEEEPLIQRKKLSTSSLSPSNSDIPCCRCAENPPVTRTLLSKYAHEQTVLNGTIEKANVNRNTVKESETLTEANKTKEDEDNTEVNVETGVRVSKIEHPTGNISKGLNGPVYETETYGSPKVIPGDEVFHVPAIITDQPKLSNEPQFKEKQEKQKCSCDECREQYSEIHVRIDELTHDYQWQNQKVNQLSATMQKLRSFVTKASAVLVAIVICIFCLMSTTAVLGNVFGDQEQFSEDMAWNFSKSIAGLKEDFSNVATMVNEIMTRSRSVIQVTSDNYFIQKGSRRYIKWGTEGLSGQGGLRLSSNGDSIEVVAGGYYVVFCRIFYRATLYTPASIKLQYTIVQRKSQELQHAIKEFTASNGTLRHELMTQTSMYLFPGEEIQISIDSDQEKYIANFPGAHLLGIFEIA